MFWVHNYTSEGKDDSTLTLDIYKNNNTSDNEKPVRFGFDNSVYYDINGSRIVDSAEDIKDAIENGDGDIILGGDIDLGSGGIIIQ